MLVQHLLGVGDGPADLRHRPAAVRAERRAWSRHCLTALSGPLIVTEHYLMSEALFGLFWLLAGHRSALPGSACGSPGALVDCIGWLALAGGTARAGGAHPPDRPVDPGAAGRGTAAAAAALATGPARRSRAMAGLFGVTVLPWMIRNQAVQGTFAIAGGSGEGLAVRTIRYEQQFDFREPPGGDPDRLPSRARRIYRDEAEDGSAFELARRLRDELRRHGGRGRAADAHDRAPGDHAAAGLLPAGHGRHVPPDVRGPADPAAPGLAALAQHRLGGAGRAPAARADGRRGPQLRGRRAAGDPLRPGPCRRRCWRPGAGRDRWPGCFGARGRVLVLGCWSCSRSCWPAPP